MAGVGHLSLRTWLLAFALFVAVPLSSISTATAFQSAASQRQVVASDVATMADRARRVADNEIRRQKRLLEVIVEQPFTGADGASADAPTGFSTCSAAALADLAASLDHVIAIVVIDVRDRVECGTGFDIAQMGAAWLGATRAAPGAIYTSEVIQTDDGRRAMVIARAEDGGRTVALVIDSARLELIDAGVDPLVAAGGTSIVIRDAQDAVVAQSGAAVTPAQPLTPSAPDAFDPGTVSPGRDTTGTERYFAVRHLSEAPWVLITSVRRDLLEGPIEANLLASLFGSGTALMFSLGLALFLSARMAGPLQRLARASREAPPGELPDLPTDRGPLEARQLAASLKEAFSARLRSERLYRELVETVPAVIYAVTIDAAGEPDVASMFISPQGGNIVGDTANGVLQRWPSLIHPDDLPAFMAATTDDSITTLEYRVRHADGRWRWLNEIRRTVEHFEDGSRRRLGLVFDVTEQRLEEQRFRRLVDVFPEAIVVARADRRHARILFANHAAAELVGLQSPTDLLAFGPLDFVVPEQRREIERAIVRSVRQEHPIRRLPVKLRAADGRDIDAEATVTALVYHNHWSMMYVLRDTTARRELEARLAQAQKMEALGQLAGGLAHDGNNLMTAVAGYAALALRSLPEDAPARVDIALIRQVVEQGRDLNAAMLAFARRQAMRTERLDMNEVISRIKPLLGQLIGVNIAVEFDLWPAPLPVVGDRTQLQQVIINLAVNARAAMPDGGRLAIASDMLEVAADPLLEPGRYVRVSVTDTGVGVDPAIAERIFQPFFTTREAGRGSGLGLSTAYGIARQLSGVLRLVSTRRQRGARFELLIPKATQVNPAEGAAPAHAPRALDSAGPGDADKPGDDNEGTGRILLVEDQPDVRNICARTLRGAGYEVFEAEDLDGAIKIWRRHGPLDLAVTDMMLPGGDGRELAAMLHALQPGLPFVYMSGYVEALDEQSTDLRNAPFLAKPFEPIDLLNVVAGVLRTTRSEPGDADLEGVDERGQVDDQ